MFRFYTVIIISFREKLRHHTIITFLRKDQASRKSTGWHWGGVRHDPQRFVGKTVSASFQSWHGRVPISWERWIKTRDQNTASFCEKNITEESELEDFEDLIMALDACYWLHKAISVSSSRFGEDRRSDFSRLRGDFPLLRRFHVLFGAVFICIFLSLSERDLYFIPGFASMRKKGRPLALFDGLYFLLPGKEGGARSRARWEILHRLS